MHYTLKIKARFCAAHHLRGYVGKCERVHGHNYTVEAEIGAEKPDKNGLCVDYFVIADMLALLTEQLDHRDLNTLPPFDVINPSAENLAKWFYDALVAQLRKGPHKTVNLCAITVWETPDFCVRYSERSAN